MPSKKSVMRCTGATKLPVTKAATGRERWYEGGEKKERRMAEREGEKKRVVKRQWKEGGEKERERGGTEREDDEG
jgi:hypothetical protein